MQHTNLSVNQDRWPGQAQSETVVEHCQLQKQVFKTDRLLITSNNLCLYILNYLQWHHPATMSTASMIPNRRLKSEAGFLMCLHTRMKYHMVDVINQWKVMLHPDLWTNLIGDFIQPIIAASNGLNGHSSFESLEQGVFSLVPVFHIDGIVCSRHRAHVSSSSLKLSRKYSSAKKVVAISFSH